MLLALCLFVCTYLLMLGLPQDRPWIALRGAVRTRDFLRIGVPFTLAAVLSGYGYRWLIWGS